MSVHTAWMLIAGVTLTTFLVKATGPVLLGGRTLPRWSAGVIAMLAPALLAALVAVSTLTDEQHVRLGPVTAGVVVAALIAWRGRPVTVAVLAAAVTTALLRQMM